MSAPPETVTDGRWAAALRDLIHHHPVPALVRGVAPAAVTSLLPRDWRPGDGAGADDRYEPAAPNLPELLRTPERLLHFAHAQHRRGLRARPRQLLQGWARDLAALAELFEAIGGPDREAFRALLRRSAGRPGSTGETATRDLADRVVAQLHDHLPAPAPGAGKPAGIPVRQAIALVCGHQVDLEHLSLRLGEEIERWCDPGWVPAPARLARHERWSELAAELIGAVRRAQPPTVAGATARLVAASPLRLPVHPCWAPPSWAAQVTDAAYQPLGCLTGTGQGAGAGALLTPRHDPALPLSARQLSYLLLIICHELDPGHAAHLAALQDAGPRGALLALSRPPAWFEGLGVRAERAALSLLPDPEVEWQVRFHRLRRLVSAATLVQPRGAETGRWVRRQLERLGRDLLDPVLAGLSPDLTSVVYAYGSCLAEELDCPVPPAAG